MTEPRYTLDEARAEMRRAECESAGHQPAIWDATVSYPCGTWLCDCGKVRWVVEGRT